MYILRKKIYAFLFQENPFSIKCACSCDNQLQSKYHALLSQKTWPAHWYFSCKKVFGSSWPLLGTNISNKLNITWYIPEIWNPFPFSRYPKRMLFVYCLPSPVSFPPTQHPGKLYIHTKNATPTYYRNLVDNVHIL